MSLSRTAYLANGFAVGGMMEENKYIVALGYISTCVPEMVIDVDDPLGMMRQVYDKFDELRRHVAELENKLSKTISEINKDEDDRIKAWETVDELRRHVAELEAENDRLLEAFSFFSSMCEALMSRMTICRQILTNNKPTRNNNWGMLDITIDKKIFDEQISKAALKEVDGGKN